MINQVCLVVDRSGSMNGKEHDTVGGINSTIDEIKKNMNEDEQYLISLKLFDHEQIMFWRTKSINDISPMNVNDFVPRGQTALYDAIGDTIIYYKTLKDMNPDAFTNCTIWIATDGYENMSKKYTPNTLSNLITEVKSLNINILYLAANQDAIFSANQIGISSANAINYVDNNEANIEAVYRSAAAATCRGVSTGNYEFLQTERQASQQYQDDTPIQNTPKKSRTNVPNSPVPPPIRRSNNTNYTLPEIAGSNTMNNM